MENASLLTDVWNDVATFSLQSHNVTLNLANTRDLALKVISLIVGSVGVLGNSFVLIVFILFIKITEKVLQNMSIGLYIGLLLYQYIILRSNLPKHCKIVTVCIRFRLLLYTFRESMPVYVSVIIPST